MFWVLNYKYNAIEHLIIRLLKYFKIKIPSGASSHKKTLQMFNTLIQEKEIILPSNIIPIIENLMAFRHIATKIYRFLLDENKLNVIIEDIKQNHNVIKNCFIEIVFTISTD